MIVYITEILLLDSPNEPSSYSDSSYTNEEFESVTELLDQYCVHHTVDLREDTIIFTVYQQKITLDEFAVNRLFYNVLSVYFDIEIEYAATGGNGIDMSINVRNKKG